MLKKELGQLYEEIYHLQNCELALGEYYQQLAALLPEEKLFWEGAVSDEINHAMQVGKLIGMISSNPLIYGSGRYRVAMLSTYLEGIYENIEKIKRKELPPNEALRIAFDYENSVLETKPYDIVNSSDSSFREFKGKFIPELLEHSERIRQFAQKKIEELAGGVSAAK